MGRRRAVAPPSSAKDEDPLISELREKHRLDIENLTLTKQPFRTSKFFVLATLRYLKRSVLYILRKRSWIKVTIILLVLSGFLLTTIDGPHEKHVQEVLHYARFVLWWVALGVASSIGLGSGLHTFVLYLGPHIAFLTIKALQCGRVDLKIAPYDTIQLKRSPSWLEKDCSAFGPPLYSPSPNSLVRIPLSKILPQVQLEAILWGLGTALGELPPYFISRAARLSGNRLEAMEELNAASSEEDGFISRMKRWLLSHSQHINFFTILVLASVPNPLFDLAGIMCGQFGVPFWKFFLATLIGKAIIKSHIQTVFIISLCNNQLLELIEEKLVLVFGNDSSFSAMLPIVIAKLDMVREKYLSAPAPASDSSTMKGKQWNFSFTLIWNTFIWLTLMNFFAKIVTSTAQRYLKKRHDEELSNTLSKPKSSNAKSNCKTGM
ncbi:vacuole membrane protein KMS1-like [Typha latifolia]|uniref:vacuole membrane protein KMS1-like n=1 Tax=Typha latifolia TaxID=4733 RepID=UPI003C2FA545